MKPKDIVRHKITNEVGFILCLRPDISNEHLDVQWAFSTDNNNDASLSFKDKALINQGCYRFSELDLIYTKN